MFIRKENAADSEEISQVTIAAFKTLPISNHTEQFIINALRVAGALTISLVAEIDGRVVGHIAFSPVTISDRYTRLAWTRANFCIAGVSQTRHWEITY